MYMQALLGPGTAGVHIEFLQVTEDSIISPLPDLSLTLKPNLPVRVLSLYNLEMSHHMLTGASVGLWVVGAASCRPLASQSATTHTDPIPHWLDPLPSLMNPCRPQLLPQLFFTIQ